MTDTLEDMARKEEIMDCQMGLGCSHGYLKINDKGYYFCTKIKREEESRSYDCAYRSKLLFRTIAVETGEVTDYYQCIRSEMHGK